MLNKVKQSKDQGFTIIEVMIVLAIAGLILLIVFLAIPALQRNSRNTQRKSDASRLAGLISEYKSTNNGRTPTGFGTAAGQLSLAGENWAIITAPTAVAAMPTGTPPTPAPDAVLVYTGARCAGANTPSAAPTARATVVYYGIEGSTATQCIDV